MHAMMQIALLMPWLSQARLEGDPAATMLRVHTDTRSIEPGDLFVALKGERFDANDMLAQAQERGAVAALCHASADRSAITSMACIVVPDTRLALGELALGWRQQFTLPLIAVTGSNGKTTVTQMIAAILEASEPAGGALATLGNLNNDIGVPQTLLRLRAQHHIAVVEMGMNHPGEIAHLAAMAQPTVAVITNAQREHLEFMHTVEAVAHENGAVISALAATGVVVIPRDDDHACVWDALAAGRVVRRFAMGGAPTADCLVCLQAQWHQGAWQVHAAGLGHDLNYRLAIAGRHNVSNSLAAAVAALAAGVPAAAVERGLQAFVPVNGRSRALQLTLAGRPAITLVDDTYNANPDSVRSAIDVLAQLPGPRLLVLGDMGEVGQQGPLFHTEAGDYAQAQGIEHLFTLGDSAQRAANAFVGGRHFDTLPALIDALPQQLAHVNSVLVKGSRFMRMERVVQAAMGLADTVPQGQEADHAH